MGIYRHPNESVMFTVAATWNYKFKTEHILISYILMFLNESL